MSRLLRAPLVPPGRSVPIPIPRTTPAHLFSPRTSLATAPRTIYSVPCHRIQRSPSQGERRRPSLPRWQFQTHPHPSNAQQQLRSYHHHDPDGSRRRTARALFTGDDFRRLARSPGTHGVIIIAIAGALIFYFSNLETVPISGRTRFNVYGADTVREAGEMQYRAVLYDIERAGAKVLPGWDPRTVRVKRVMRKLIPFSGMADEKWEIFVIEDPRMSCL